jgi:GDP-L-fucose synthase
MPTNLYGPGDNFHHDHAHVLPAVMRRLHDAKEMKAPSVSIWGSGKPRREFLHVDDLADALLFLMRTYDRPDLINVGWGRDHTILELAETIADVVGYSGSLKFDTSKPDGAPQKLLDTARINRLGWHPRIRLVDGVKSTYEWFSEHQADLRS